MNLTKTQMYAIHNALQARIDNLSTRATHPDIPEVNQEQYRREIATLKELQKELPLTHRYATITAKGYNMPCPKF